MKNCMRHMEPYGYSNFDPICKDPACKNLVENYTNLEKKVAAQMKTYQEAKRKPQNHDSDEEMSDNSE